MSRLGNRINKMGIGKKEKLVLKVGEQVETIWFDFSLPEAVVQEAHAYAEKFADGKAKGGAMDKAERDRHYTIGIVKFYAAAGFRDKDDELVWESPDGLEASGIIYSQIQTFIMQNVMGIMPISLEEEEVKK